MPIIGDLVNQIQVAIASFWYNILMMLATFQWSLLRGALMMGYTIQLLTDWLALRAFSPLIQQTGNNLQAATSWAFVIALFVLGITYMLASIVRLNVVSPRNAILWYIAGAIFFQIGPQLYQGMGDFRRTVSSVFYLSVLQSAQSTTGQSFSSLNNVQSTDLPIFSPCDNFGPYLGRTGGSGPVLVSGLDVALAYLRADGIDVMGYPYPSPSNCPAHNPPVSYSIPWEWYNAGSYFDSAKSASHFQDMNGSERDKSLSMASASLWRTVSGWSLVWFAIFEQFVALCLTVAQGMTFVSFACAILFAFFRRTEGIAWSMVDRMIETIVHTVVVAMLQALVVSFFLAGAATNNGLVVMGVGLVCLILMLILLWSGFKAIWRSFNGLIDAMSKATGGTLMSMGEATGTVLSAGAAVATGGMALAGNALGGASSLMSGASWSQAPGLASGGSQLLSGATRTLGANDDILEGEFTPLRPARMGRFTPLTSMPSELLPAPSDIVSEVNLVAERSDAVEQDTDEEMEQHISDVVGNHSPVSQSETTHLDAAASKLEQAADRLMEGRANVAGGANVASVMGDVTTLMVQNGLNGVDKTTVNNTMAQVMGITPLTDGTPPIEQDTSRFGVLTTQVLGMGLDGAQTERVVREVKESPEGKVAPETRAELVEHLRTTQNVSEDGANHQVNRLEHNAGLLPNSISAYGLIPAPTPPTTVNVEPRITVNPIIQVNADPEKSAMDGKADESMAGSESLWGGEV